MKKGKYIFIIILFVYAILITSGTYAYLYAEDSNTNTFAGNMSTANVDLEVSRVTPSESNGTSRLVPLLDAALKNALKGMEEYPAVLMQTKTFPVKFIK